MAIIYLQDCYTHYIAKIKLKNKYLRREFILNIFQVCRKMIRIMIKKMESPSFAYTLMAEFLFHLFNFPCRTYINKKMDLNALIINN